MALSRQELLALARSGAAVRIAELQGEIAKLQKTFGAVAVGVRAGVAALRKSRKSSAAGRKRGKLSAAGRRAIVIAQKARWSKVNRSGGRKRKEMSAAGKAAVSKRMKAYWKAQREAEK